MKAPLTFAYRNVLFGSDVGDAWGVYRLATRSYDGLTSGEKKELLSALAAFAYGLERDFTLLRVTRPWSSARYIDGAEATLDARYGHRDPWRRYVRRHGAQLGDRQTASAEVYVSVRLAESSPTLAGQLGALARKERSGWTSELRSLVGLGDPRGISERELERLMGEQEKVFARTIDYLECEPASTHELQWLIRRAFCRGVGEPTLDEHFVPQALVFADEAQDGAIYYKPLEHDLLRLFDSPINVEARGLRIESECGESHQAFLSFGALPEAVVFPGRQAELLFAPLEALDFPVDAAFSARFVPNDQALALARRRIIDADQIFTEESHGDHGPSSNSAYRPRAARELEEYLSEGSRPPLLCSTISLALAAGTGEELEARIERVRREYGALKLYRPLGEQLRFFIGHLPGQASTVRDYEDYLLVEQFGAMVAIATHAVGSAAGPYIGYTLSGSTQPVLFDLSEASRTSRPPSILCAGTLGSGKTMFMQLLLYQAFLQGSRIVDIDPKGDHNLHLLPGVAECVEIIELSGDETYRGMLDPLRIAAPSAAEDLATNFLIDVLPAPVAAEWKTAIRAAVRAVAARTGDSGANCTAVIDELVREGSPEAAAAGKALSVYSDTGLARLGFAAGASQPPGAGSSQVTSLRIRNLPRPIPGTPKSELSEDERIGQAILRLLAAYAMHLMGGDPTRHKVLGFDEAWFLLQDSAGRRLVEHLNRWGRSLFATPILATHMIADAEEVDNLIGARFVFGMESEQEAARALSVLRLDPEDEHLRARLLAYRKGRCLFRDYEGRVASVQIDLADPALVAALDTTPGVKREAPGEEAAEEADEEGKAALARDAL